MVLQAVVDARKRFIVIDVAKYGSMSDAGIFRVSLLKKGIVTGLLELPSPSKFPNSNVESPYYLIGDGAYPLKPYLMKPYGKKILSPEEGVNIAVAPKLHPPLRGFRCLRRSPPPSPPPSPSRIKVAPLFRPINEFSFAAVPRFQRLYTGELGKSLSGASDPFDELLPSSYKFARRSSRIHSIPFRALGKDLLFVCATCTLPRTMDNNDNNSGNGNGGEDDKMKRVDKLSKEFDMTQFHMACVANLGSLGVSLARTGSQLPRAENGRCAVALGFS
ncbi:unnamed protein product [Trichogramma brassicae]|uniref:DDE Tnp4 domain-containing protein n=1 Tax=Trichogramma brassicae TaxID=86971 RepID=A0A6H5IGU4_9HYME|nr:unnamed protein product [Trichogramma brassicae]